MSRNVHTGHGAGAASPGESDTAAAPEATTDGVTINRAVVAQNETALTKLAEKFGAEAVQQLLQNLTLQPSLETAISSTTLEPYDKFIIGCVKNIKKLLVDAKDASDFRSQPVGTFGGFTSSQIAFKDALKPVINAIDKFENRDALRSKIRHAINECDLNKSELDSHNKKEIPSNEKAVDTATRFKRAIELAETYEKSKKGIESLKNELMDLQNISKWRSLLSQALMDVRKSEKASNIIHNAILTLESALTKIDAVLWQQEFSPALVVKCLTMLFNSDDQLAKAKEMEEQAQATATEAYTAVKTEAAAVDDLRTVVNGFRTSGSTTGLSDISALTLAGAMSLIPSMIKDTEFMKNQGGWSDARIAIIKVVNAYAIQTTGKQVPFVTDLPEQLERYYKDLIFELRPLNDIIIDLENLPVNDDNIIALKAKTTEAKALSQSEPSDKLWDATYESIPDKQHSHLIKLNRVCKLLHRTGQKNIPTLFLAVTAADGISLFKNFFTKRAHNIAEAKQPNQAQGAAAMQSHA